jgi:glycosyltransferase involved in cell wall biosynthesis
MSSGARPTLDTVDAAATGAAPTTPSAAAPELAGLRVLLVHEWLYTWAGGERCLEQLALMMPQADVLAGIVRPDMRQRHPVARRARESWVGIVPGARTHHRWFLPLHAVAFGGFDASAYDLVVSVSHAFEKAVRRRADATHVCYCLTPPRFLWSLSEAHERFATPLQRAALRLGRAPFRALDRRLSAGVDHFVSLSQVVADRVRLCYSRNSAVVFPPVEAKPVTSRTSARESFLLSLGRLVPYKRVDLAVQAANRLGLRLVVAGDGPERARLEAMAGTHVEFVGEVSEEEAGRLYASCAAFVFCAEEDFGIAPLEANAHGAPVVAFGRGAATETMRENVTAVFFREQTVEAVETAIRRCLERTWSDVALRQNAARFSPEHFREGMRREILLALEARERAGARRPGSAPGRSA